VKIEVEGIGDVVISAFLVLLLGRRAFSGILFPFHPLFEIGEKAVRIPASSHFAHILPLKVRGFLPRNVLEQYYPLSSINVKKIG